MMIELKNVCKTYVCQSGKINALNDVSLTLGDCGMCFILGKSGSGKSTLLNLLGCLDKPDSGDILINNRLMTELKTKDYDAFRNTDVGFIFQDYNLISNISVYENLDLALALNGNDENRIKIKTALKDVGLENMENRMPSQLSRGQQQRIAIARAIVKKPAIILADEPTGNLDEETGNQIMKLLKELSKAFLVVVVTHDREYAESYGDQIIELKDGRILSDSIKHAAPLNNRPQTTHDGNKKVISDRICLKMGFANIRNRIWRSTIAIILLSLSVMVTIFSMMVGLFSTEKGIHETIRKNEDEYIYFYDSTKDRYGKIIPTYDDINRNIVKELFEDTTFVKRSNTFFDIYSPDGIYHGIEPYGIFGNIRELQDFGLVFYEGYHEIDDESIVVSDYSIDQKIYQSKKSAVKLIIVEGTKETLIDADDGTYQNLIGKTLNTYTELMGTKQYGTPFRIAAIYHTDYKKYYNEDFEKKETISDDDFHNWLTKKGHIYLEFMTKKYHYELIKLESKEIKIRDFSPKNYSMNIYYKNEKQVLQNAGITGFQNAEKAKIITSNGFFPEEGTLNNDEVIINLDMYNQLFKENNDVSFYLDNGNIINYPQHFGETISYSIFDKDLNQTVVTVELKIAGVLLESPQMPSFPEPRIYVKQQNMEQIQETLDHVYSMIMVHIGGKQDKLLTLIRKYAAYDLFPIFNYSTSFYAYETGIRQTRLMMTIIGASLLFISFLLINNLLFISIINKKKEIGILKSLGSSNRMIHKIFLVESLLIGFCSLAITMLTSPVLPMLLNSILCPKENQVLTFFTFEPSSLLIILVLTLLVPFFSTIIPIRKIVLMKPIDAIKDYR